ncbi:MAG TPA: helix-turn-helix transcriptional regulator [Kofleriaceae bacterium]|nr:helix-turn-helix transcriptional regulator [Kofleriaceae bacterium]
MAKKRQWPDGTVLIRTYPVTFLHDVTEHRHDRKWHQLTFATRGHLEVRTEDARRFVPADRAVWVPAGVEHTTIMRAPISMRSIFVAVPFAPTATRLRTIEVLPLLRELILHVTRIGALDRSIPAQARLAGVLLDLLASAAEVTTELPSPRDPRAQKLAELIVQAPSDERSLAQLARKAGGSLRTLERCFLAETGLALGTWRRQVRLFHAQRLLALGTPVTEVALEAGYANPSAFGHAFRQFFGVTPNLVRKR